MNAPRHHTTFAAVLIVLVLAWSGPIAAAQDCDPVTHPKCRDIVLSPDGILLSRGDTGNLVRKLQGQLNLPAIGIYDDSTVAAVTEFQRAMGLKKIDGMTGPETQRALGWRK